MKKKVKIAIAVIFAVLLALVIGTRVYLSKYYHSGQMAQNAIWYPANGVTVTEEEDKQIVFMPDDVTAGLIFYPGAKVEYTAYAPLMERLAENGIMCVLLHMPGNMAFFDMDAADEIKSAYPEISRWYVCGHSLGGAMVSSYVADHTTEYEGLILLAAYSTSDLTESGLRVLTIYGTEDLVLGRNAYEKNWSNLPNDATEFVIDGGCHAYFGDYGEQDGDGVATITRDEQIETTVDAIVHLIKMNQ